ncbi:MAG: hypothetical protein KJI69_05630 [Patescibacteria group bacterium]|nr:hypothetical protein [Patescibacteria group bacterium]
MTKISKKKFIEAAKGTGGVQAVVAKKMGVERATVSIYVKKNPWAEEILETEREKIIDLAERKLFLAADNDEKWAIERILRTLGKSRGYGDYQQIDHGEGLKIIIEKADNANSKMETNSKAGKGVRDSKR